MTDFVPGALMLSQPSMPLSSQRALPNSSSSESGASSRTGRASSANGSCNEASGNAEAVQTAASEHAARCEGNEHPSSDSDSPIIGAAFAPLSRRKHC
eukprot:1268742-Alexandrium_andersonii.AAC.1